MHTNDQNTILIILSMHFMWDSLERQSVELAMMVLMEMV